MATETKQRNAPLTSAKIESTKPTDKTVKLYDANGLYLLIKPTGARGWRLKYRWRGREKLLSLGPYPSVSLKEARKRRDAARAQLEQGTDPSKARQDEKRSTAISFKSVADEYLDLREHTTTFSTQAKQIWLLDRLKPLHTQSVVEIEPADIRAVVQKIEREGKNESAHRAAQLAKRIFDFAINTGRRPVGSNPASSLRGVLVPVQAKHLAAITDPEEIGKLLVAIDGYDGSPVVCFALRLAPLVFVRPRELRTATWSEFDLDGATWRIPAERMKMKEGHTVPLSAQAVAAYRSLHEITGRASYVFPGVLKGRPMSDNSVTTALRRMGYTGAEQTWHGFRTIASTLLNEMGYHSDLIERQLAHRETNKVRDAYNRAERLDDRRAMMQAYADRLDELKVKITR